MGDNACSLDHQLSDWWPTDRGYYSDFTPSVNLNDSNNKEFWNDSQQNFPLRKKNYLLNLQKMAKFCEEDSLDFSDDKLLK